MNPLRYWKTILGLLVVFFTGLVIGGVLTLGVLHRVVQERQNPENWSSWTMSWFRKELHVSSEQEKQLQPIVEKAMGKMASLRDDADTRWRRIVGEMILDARPLLTSQQQTRLGEIIQQSEASGGRRTHAFGGKFP